MSPGTISSRFVQAAPDPGNCPIFRDALMELGNLGGILDANDDLAAGPVALIVDPNLSLINREQSNPHGRRNVFRSVP